jgi:hypothetical protein
MYVCMQVLRRFFSYRGYPKFIRSDKDTQMVGAENELRLMIKGWNVKELTIILESFSGKFFLTTRAQSEKVGQISFRRPNFFLPVRPWSNMGEPRPPEDI